MYTVGKFFAIFGKKYGSFSKKNLWRIFLCQNSFPAIVRQKIPFSTKLEDGGGGRKALVAGPIKKMRLPLLLTS